jgi:integrase/recombinase XerD
MAKRKLPIILEREEAYNLIKQPNKRYPTGLRNKAIISLMLNSGLRVSEITNLKSNDINLTKGNLRVVSGKGAKDRDIPFIPENTISLLKEWKQVRPEKAKYFFTTIVDRENEKFSSKKGSRLSERYLQIMIKRYSQKAKIDKVVTPHTLRHSFATDFYKRTKDIEALRKILGHSDISTTQIYITLANLDVEKALKDYNGFV